MKKLMKLMCVFALVFVAGCGASSSTDEQKEVVTNFFDYVKECDITKLKKVASEDVLSGMDLEKMEKELSQYTEEEYGKVFVDETNKFKKAIFKDLFTDIKIKDIPFLNYCSIPSMSRIREISSSSLIFILICLSVTLTGNFSTLFIVFCKSS